MPNCSSLLIATFILLSSSGLAFADFMVNARTVSVDGVSVTGNSITDPFGNVLTLTSFSSVGIGLFDPAISFTASMASSDFHPGDDQLTSVFTITNLDGGSSLTFVEQGGFSFAVDQFGRNAVMLDGNETLTINGSSAVSGPFTLNGVPFRVLGYGEASGYAPNSGIGIGEGMLDVRFLVTPEPSSIVLGGIAGVMGSAIGLLRRRIAPRMARENSVHGNGADVL